jgi:hypothetical protein
MHKRQQPGAVAGLRRRGDFKALQPFLTVTSGADNWLSYVTKVAGAEGGTEGGGFASSLATLEVLFA